MSINWVMLTPTNPPTFTPLAHEQTLYTSPPRTTLSLTTLNKYPGKEPFSLSSSQGTLYLTNRRILYLPATPTPQLQSFAVPILNTHDSHVVAPWIGPNVWTALVQPVQGGGIPAQHAAVELKVTFKEGGAYDFHGRYERVKERLQQAVEVARESGGGVSVGDGSERGRGRGGGGLSGVDVGNVHLEDLPAYEEASSGGSGGIAMGSSAMAPSAAQGGGFAAAAAPPPPPPPAESVAETTRGVGAQETFTAPAEPPPGYEEVQRETVADELERRLNEQQQRQ